MGGSFQDSGQKRVDNGARARKGGHISAAANGACRAMTTLVLVDADTAMVATAVSSAAVVRHNSGCAGRATRSVGLFAWPNYRSTLHSLFEVPHEPPASNPSQ